MVSRRHWAGWEWSEVVTKGRRTGWLVVVYSYINLLKSLYFLNFFDFLEFPKIPCFLLIFLIFLIFRIFLHFLNFPDFLDFLDFPDLFEFRRISWFPRIFLNFHEFLAFLFSGSWLDLLGLPLVRSDPFWKNQKRILGDFEGFLQYFEFCSMKEESWDKNK